MMVEIHVTVMVETRSYPQNINKLIHRVIHRCGVIVLLLYEWLKFTKLITHIASSIRKI
jgi:hypothetical protein